LLEKIVLAEVDFPKYFSKSVRDLLSNMLNPNPKKRFTSTEIKSHPWFNE
jgi:serine/threonine protein kinase